MLVIVIIINITIIIKLTLNYIGKVRTRTQFSKSDMYSSILAFLAVSSCLWLLSLPHDYSFVEQFLNMAHINKIYFKPLLQDAYTQIHYAIYTSIDIFKN